MKTVLGSTILICFALIQSYGQALVSVDLQKNSSLIIHGNSNLISFRFIQSWEKLSKKNMTIETTQTENKILLEKSQLSIAMKDFTSSNKMALRDFLKLVKSDIYPQMFIKVLSLESEPMMQKNPCFSGTAQIEITLTGVTKQYTLPITTRCDGNVYHVEGHKRMNIRDFGLTPPVEMMGLIRVSEWIEIDLLLVCKITPLNIENYKNIWSNRLDQRSEVVKH